MQVTRFSRRRWGQIPEHKAWQYATRREISCFPFSTGEELLQLVTGLKDFSHYVSHQSLEERFGVCVSIWNVCILLCLAATLYFWFPSLLFGKSTAGFSTVGLEGMLLHFLSNLVLFAPSHSHHGGTPRVLVQLVHHHFDSEPWFFWLLCPTMAYVLCLWQR